MGLLHLLTGMRNGLPRAGSGGGMLLIMIALAGLLTKKPVRGIAANDDSNTSCIRRQ